MEITRGQWIIIILLTLSFIATAGFVAFGLAAVLSFGPAYLYLKSIRKGTVKTYKQVAIAINRPKSARAVANAVGKNPFAPKIPCHRVIRSDGSLGGYSGKGGVKTKKLLLKSEGVIV